MRHIQNREKLWAQVGLWGLAAAAGLMPLPPRAVEQLFSGGVYPRFQAVVTPLANIVPFSLMDALIAAVFGWFLVLVLRDRASGWRVVAWRGVLRAVTVAAVSYLAFVCVWGLNYRRTPLGERLAFDRARVSRDAVIALANVAVDRVNVLHVAAHAAAPQRAHAIDPALAAAFGRMQRDLGYSRRAVPGRPKTSVLDPYFTRAGVAGMTDPFFLETLIATDLLAFERPVVLAHEWSHLAGITDEGEANFAGWLTCLRAEAPHQYSGWLFLYGELVAALPPGDARVVSARLASGPRADLQAIRDRLQRNVKPRIADAGWRVYDKYLKANRVEEGAASYAQVVRLATGVPFTGDYVPVLRHR